MNLLAAGPILPTISIKLLTKICANVFILFILLTFIFSRVGLDVLAVFSFTKRENTMVKTLVKYWGTIFSECTCLDSFLGRENKIIS